MCEFQTLNTEDLTRGARWLLGLAIVFACGMATAAEPASLALAPSSSVPPKERVPADLSEERLQEEKEKEARREREAEELAVANRTVLIENHTRGEFTYRVYSSSGEVLSDAFTLPAGKRHRFVAPKDRPSREYATLSPAGAPGNLVIRFEQEKQPGVVLHRLFTNRRYAMVENGNGFRELLFVEAIKQSTRLEDHRRVPEIKPLTEPGKEAERMFLLRANLCWQH